MRALRAEGHSLRHLLECSGLRRSTYYYALAHPRRPTRPELRDAAAEIFSRTANGCGHRQIAMCLRAELGAVVADKTVLKMMREMGIRCGLATLMWTVPGGARETGGPYMRDPRHPRHFTDEFKRQIVDLYNAGKPKREIMDEYDLGKSTVERWIKSINATGSPRAACNRTPEQNRILELERENRRLRMEVDVLKQAALIYARK